MYRTHFALREPPFGLTPDTAFAFACTPHQEALNTLLVAAATVRSRPYFSSAS